MTPGVLIPGVVNSRIPRHGSHKPLGSVHGQNPVVSQFEIWRQP
jgi:hypothetical protein